MFWISNILLKLWLFDEYLKYSFYLYVLLRFLVFFMLNKCLNALNIHLHD